MHGDAPFYKDQQNAASGVERSDGVLAASKAERGLWKVEALELERLRGDFEPALFEPLGDAPVRLFALSTISPASAAACKRAARFVVGPRTETLPPATVRPTTEGDWNFSVR